MVMYPPVIQGSTIRKQNPTLSNSPITVKVRITYNELTRILPGPIEPHMGRSNRKKGREREKGATGSI